MTEGKDVAPFLFFFLVIDWDVERRSLFFSEKKPFYLF